MMGIFYLSPKFDFNDFRKLPIDVTVRAYGIWCNKIWTGFQRYSVIKKDCALSVQFCDSSRVYPI